jgi:hypothetical protein
MLPGANARMRSYQNSTQDRRMPFIHFRDDDVVSFIFDPMHIDRAADARAYEEDINQYMESLGLPLRTNGTVTMHLTTNAANRADGQLGGIGQFSYNFDLRPHVDLAAFMDLMEDRMYTGFDLHHVRIIIDIRAYDFVRAHFRGGADIMTCLQNLPSSKYPVVLTDFWSTQSKAIYQRRYKLAAPKHLKNVKGLMLYKWERGWYRNCAVMAIIYGVALQKLNVMLDYLWNMGKEHKTPFAANQEFLTSLLSNTNSNGLLVQDLLSECLRLQHSHTLYRSAIDVVKVVPLTPFPAHNQLGEFFNHCYPHLTLVVVDESRHILYMRNGSTAPVQDPPEKGYIATHRKLTWEEINKYQLQRVYIFYDHVLQHYHPIYNLERFLSRSTIHVDMENTITAQANCVAVSKPVIRTVDRRMTFCPFCDAGMDAFRINDHTCNILRCVLCDMIFPNEAEKMKHCNPHVLRKRGCFGVRCLKEHQTVCSGISYSQCQVCFASVSHKLLRHHKCKGYMCHGCEKNVSNRLNYDHPDHPDGYIVYHPCAMPGKEVMEKRKSKDTLAGALFFTFDFESMLTFSEYRDITIHIHTVNCISSAEIIVTANRQNTEPAVWTQYTLEHFWLHVIEKSTAKRNFWIAHNFKGYDGRLMFDFFQSRNIVPSQLLWQGGKLMQMQIAHPSDGTHCIIFQDSLNHIATSLSKMPKMFGIPENIARKGFFPYMFNIAENQGYVGPVPPLQYFNVENLADPSEFMAWYNEMVDSGYVYDLREEMRLYCENDALILSLSLSRYAVICAQYSKVNPLPYLTIAQFTFQHYRMSYLPVKTVYYLDHSFDLFARRALHGGNTNVRRLFYECTPEEAGTIEKGDKGLRYIDVQSLYPTVQYYDAMPIGYPETIMFYTANSQPSERLLKTFFGFIECDIRPKRFMFHPLLGRFADNRLYMDLHPQTKVVLTSIEFQTAITERGGYECTRVYRIDMYQSSLTLFREFIRNWLRLKILSSEPPYAADTPEFVQYQQQLYERLEISVEASDFKPNPSLRTLAKLVLNSLWGKFGQRSNLIECKIITTANDAFDYHQLRRMGHLVEKEDMSLGTIASMKKCQRLNKWNKKNVAIAAFVTAHARLRLWDVLEKLGERVVYHDTDSVIYERRNADDMMIKEGCFLGQWESETKNYMIHSFVGIAPKTYAYKYMDFDKKKGAMVEVERVKSKGFSMKPTTTALLNYDRYREMIMAVRAKALSMQNVAIGGLELPATINPDSLQVRVPTLLFRHIPKMGVTFTHEDYKVLSFDYKKGFVNYHNWQTYPYGTQLFIGDPIFQWQIDPISEDPLDNEDHDLMSATRAIFTMYEDDDECDAEILE